MKIYLFNEEYTARLKIGEEWKYLGTATSGMTAKGTPYYEMDVDDEIIVDKLRDIDWKPKSSKTAQFVSEVEETVQKDRYPNMYRDEAEEKFQDY